MVHTTAVLLGPHVEERRAGSLVCLRGGSPAHDLIYTKQLPKTLPSGTLPP